MTRRGLLFVWIALLLLMALELGATSIGFGVVAPAIGIAMTAVIGLCFMRLRTASSLSRIFALAGVFWLVVLLGLTSMDVFTRSDYPAPMATEPGE